MYYTCDACHYTFEAEMLPNSCPDCGKEEIGRRIKDRIIKAPAVRKANEEEIEWYKNIQDEITTEENQKKAIKKLSEYDMTDDEFNWSIILSVQYITQPLLIEPFIRFARIGDNTESTLNFYIQTRRDFSRRVTDDKNELKERGIMEQGYPIDRELPIEDYFDYWKEIGVALQAVYYFRNIPFLHTPNLGDVRKIDLKKITEQPSDGYKQFLLDWENKL